MKLSDDILSPDAPDPAGWLTVAASKIHAWAEAARELEAQVEKLTAERDEARDIVSEAWSGFPKGTEHRDLRMKLATALDEWDAESDTGKP